MGFESMSIGAPETQERKPAEIIKEKLDGLSGQEKSFVKGIRAHDALLDLAEAKIKDKDPELYSDIREELISLFESLHDVYKKPQESNRKGSVDLEHIGHDLNKEIGSIGEAVRKEINRQE